MVFNRSSFYCILLFTYWTRYRFYFWGLICLIVELILIHHLPMVIQVIHLNPFLNPVLLVLVYSDFIRLVLDFQDLVDYQQLQCSKNWVAVQVDCFLELLNYCLQLLQVEHTFWDEDK